MVRNGDDASLAADSVGPLTVVITGAGSGLGRAMTRSVAGAGHRVVLAGRRASALEETKELCVADGAAANALLVAPTDVTDPAAVEALFDAAVGSFGAVDVLVNNAGGRSPVGSADEVSLTDWQDAVAVNLTGTFLCTAEAMRRMKAQTPQGGRIINNGSVAAHVPRPRSVAYTSTKHAITGLTRSIELDGRGVGIRGTQIDIGNAATPMTERMAAGVPQADGTVRVEPTFDPAYVGEMVRYLVELPLEVTVPFVTIAAAEMPWIARG